MAVLARHSARFDVLQVQFDPISGKHLAVAGLRTLQVRMQPPIVLKMLLYNLFFFLKKKENLCLIFAFCIF